jgi:hypothetical protein
MATLPTSGCSASQLRADLSPLRAPNVYDFRDRNDRLSGHLSDSVNVRSVYQMYSIGLGGGSAA